MLKQKINFRTFIGRKTEFIVQRRGTFNGNLDTLYKGATTHGDIFVSTTKIKLLPLVEIWAIPLE